MAKNENGVKTEGSGGQFEAFLHLAGTFFQNWCGQVRALNEAKDRDPAMRLYQTAIGDAWAGATQELSQLYQSMEAPGRAELDRSVVISGMLSLVEGANSLVSSRQLVSLAPLLDLASIVEKIKQFIRCILACLGIDICILNCLFLLIDNFFGNFLGPVSREQAEHLYELETRASKMRILMHQERNLTRKGCSCAG
jgi:hypothetical protein